MYLTTLHKTQKKLIKADLNANENS